MSHKKNLAVAKTRKLVIVGDGTCGKTCLLYAFTHDTFDPKYAPTIFDTHATEIQVDRKRITLALFDTAGQEDFDRLRPLSYPDTNVVLICFSVDSPASAINTIEKWMPEVRHFCDQCPVILVACKKDLRTDAQTIEKLKKEGEAIVTNEVGRRIAAQIRADAYIECSARTHEGVQDLFLQAARLSLKRYKRKKHVKCTLH
ncbi:unnamed protein product [Adineta steineri]|uniref:Uncharacterized protein n=1 Tax=Adineta steineri TaxID=433720 RepID=A0A818XM67_9BILA|nr:unnamed protein product [Adineta steineri]CAF3740547.1 unnamed protein product [Adineta steineri]